MRYELFCRLLSEFHSARLLVLGDVMLDRFVYGTVERISPEAPIPVIREDRVVNMPGGAANVARNIASMGARVTLLGVVGEDSWGEELRVQLATNPGIDVHLLKDRSRPTSVKTRYVADGQQVMRADRESRVELSSAVERRVLDEYTALLSSADVIVLSDYAKGVLCDSLTRGAIEISSRAGKVTIVDPKSKDLAKYRGATILTPNRLELQQACGLECGSDEEVVDGARAILDKNVCDVVIVTRGKDGMSVVQRGEPAVHLPTTARQVFDVSGAGDTVIAAISLGLAVGAKVGDSAAIANTAAGIVVGKRGTATVTTGEIMAALRPFDGYTDSQKIFSLDSVLQLVRDWRAAGLKIAFTNGCFDLLHPGHISLLEQARGSADRLIVGLNADISIRRLKGSTRPVQGEVARAIVLSSLKSVDAVVIFAEDTPIGLIETLEPNVLVKGADYTMQTVVGADLVINRGGKVLLAELLSGHSTTDTVKRVAASVS
jgi:D-beta-D-heptose 7-phosphate kinase / D-beta-D-heptose 1-phosphate adenosyltransferase